MTSRDESKDNASSFPTVKMNLENVSREDKYSAKAPESAPSEGSGKDDKAPSPESTDSASSSKKQPPPEAALPNSPPEESPSKKSPPESPPPPPPPVGSPPPPAVMPPSSSPGKQSDHSPPPPPVPSSPPPLPPQVSSNGGNPSPALFALSPYPLDQSSNISSSNVSAIFPSFTQTAPPSETQLDNNPPSPPSTGLKAGSNTRTGGSSNDSVPSTSGGDRSSSSSDTNSSKNVGIALGAVCFAVFVVFCFFVARWRKRKRGAVHDSSHIPPNMKASGEDWRYYGLQPLKDDPYRKGSQMGNVQPLGTSESVHHMRGQIAFSYESIVEITNGFSSKNILGEGGFGCVYKGWLADGRVVAVKKLKAGSGQGDREFRAEVEIISRVHHRHLVSLVGYCISENQKILMYEFVPNRTLNDHLHGKGTLVLDWDKRVKIAIGAAKGLAYLHEDCHPKIIHRDIKSANILLDDAYVAKVADFGLAKLTDDANTHVSTRVMGTFGYMAPEYAASGKLTDRSDVFSFGVVLLELLTGRKPVDPTQPMGEESLVEWARPHLLHAVETGDFRKLIDTRLENLYVESEVQRMIEAAASCVRHSAPKRPRMLQVLRALDSGSGLIDLSNAVKYGQSTVCDSGQFDEQLMRYRMMNGVSFFSSEFDLTDEEYNLRELSGFQRAFPPDGPAGESGLLATGKGGSNKQREG